MKVGCLSLALLCGCGFVGFASCQEGPISPATTGKLDKAKVAQAVSLHSDLVTALSKGQTLESKLPEETIRSYSADLTTKKVETRGPEGTRTSTLNYKEAIARTEDVMRDGGLRVKVAIESSPAKCNIKYRPVIGGAELDAGQTNLATDMDPRWYIFSCDCIAPPIEQRVDCTQDRKIVFQCK